MAYSLIDSNQFYEIFRSNESAYGVTVVGEVSNGKAEAICKLEHSSLTPTVMKHHLEGKISIGAAPLMASNTVRWCAIDIDNYEGNLMTVVQAIEDFNIPLLPCYSKSKKLHIYCFFSEDTPAQDAINLMKWYATLFRCDSKVEIFPKQAKVSANNKFYSWINLPYFDANNQKNHRKCVSSDGSLMSLSDFIERAHTNQKTLSEHLDFIRTLPYYGAPPCVQSGVILRDIPQGTRNNWLYNVACFLRMDDENADIVEPLLEINDTLFEPLKEDEIRTTVAKVASRTYFYQCSGMIGCNKTICKSSDKGIGTNNSTKFNFGQLTKVLTDPIQWEWEVNNSVLRFHDTNQIMNQNEFRRQCMEKINDIPFRVKEEKWTAILRRAMENVIERKEEIYGNFGLGSQFLAALSDYFSGDQKYVLAKEEIITHGKIVEDKKEGTLLFNSQFFHEYIEDVSRVKTNAAEIRERLVEAGAKQVDGLIWSIPVESTHRRKLVTPTINKDTGNEYEF